MACWLAWGLLKDYTLFRPRAIVQDLDAPRVQRLAAVEDEAAMLLQKRHLAAAVRSALRLVLRALIEVAEAPDVLTGRVEQEDVDLMVGDAHVIVVPESIESLGRQLAQVVKVDHAIEPYGQVDVLRFVNVASPPAARFKPRRRSDRAEEGDASHRRYTCERLRHVAGRCAKILVASERLAIVVVQVRLMAAAHYPRHARLRRVKGSDFPASVNGTDRRQSGKSLTIGVMRSRKVGFEPPVTR